MYMYHFAWADQREKQGYRAGENFGRGKNWRIRRIINHLPNFYSPIFTDIW